MKIEITMDHSDQSGILVDRTWLGNRAKAELLIRQLKREIEALWPKIKS